MYLSIVVKAVDNNDDDIPNVQSKQCNLGIWKYQYPKKVGAKLQKVKTLVEAFLSLVSSIYKKKLSFHFSTPTHFFLSIFACEG